MRLYEIEATIVALEQAKVHGKCAGLGEYFETYVGEALDEAREARMFERVHEAAREERGDDVH